MPNWSVRPVRVPSAIKFIAQIVRSQSQKVDASAIGLENTEVMTSVVIEKRAI